jgi:nucleotide-binding universal stress UspA family protein
MFEKILVPVDLSEPSRTAFGHALSFAAAFGSSVELVHVVELIEPTHPPFWSRELSLANELHSRAARAAEASLAELIPTLAAPPGVPVSSRVLSGTLPGTLVDHAAAAGAGLIVVASHGRTGLARWLLGSVSERLLRSAPCPVLVARGGSATGQPRMANIMVAVDLSEHSRRALSVAASIAERFRAKLRVLYVWAAPFYGEGAEQYSGLFERIREQARAELDEFVASSGVSVSVELESTIVSGTPSAEILDWARHGQPDLLVLGTHGRGGIKRLVLGSVAEATARYSQCATLVVNS